MGAGRVIKKYPNRRLYDTTESRYIALDDILKLVLEAAPFEVVDAKTGEDITRPILLQIIVEQEERGQPILSADLLRKIIRFYGDAMQMLMATYLEKSVDAFVEQQASLHKQMAHLMGEAPAAAFKEMAERNVELWREFQERMLSAYGYSAGRRPPRDEDAD